MTTEQAQTLSGFIDRFKNEQPLYTFSDELTIMPYKYGKAINDFITFCLKNVMDGIDYNLIKDELIENQMNDEWFATLSEENVLRSLFFIIRKDRFIDGFVGVSIENGTIPKLLNRIKVLYQIEE